MVYFCSDRHFQGIREPYFSAQPPETIQTHLIICVHGLDGEHPLTKLGCFFFKSDESNWLRTRTVL